MKTTKINRNEVESVINFWKKTDRFEKAVLRYMIEKTRILRTELQHIVDRYMQISGNILPFDEVNLLRYKTSNYNVEMSRASYLALFMDYVMTHKKIDVKKALELELLMEYTEYQENVYKKYYIALKKAVAEADPNGRKFEFSKNKIIRLYGTSLEEMMQTNAEYYMRRLSDAIERERFKAKSNSDAKKQAPNLKAPEYQHILDMARTDMLAESPKTGNLFGILDRVYLFELGERRIEELKRQDFEKVRFVAVLDNATTDECRGLNGRIFYTKDLVIGKNAPPIYPPPHPCRSRLIGIQT